MKDKKMKTLKLPNKQNNKLNEFKSSDYQLKLYRLLSLECYYTMKWIKVVEIKF